ncbi:MAG: hypothetical protein ACI3W7_09520 [Oscillospiraceae bacterium]
MKTSKIFALILALCMVLSMGAFASAEPSAEASAEPAAAVSVEDAFIDYIHEWLLNELANNSSMTIEQVEDEFMPLVREMNFVDFPAEMIYNGMLNTGVPMTFEEFSAQYVPAAAEVSVEDAFIEYIHEWLLAEDAANDNMDESIVENEFMPLVREMNFVDFPADMLYNGMLNTGTPMTFEEFAAQYVPAAPAAGGYTADEAGYKAYLKDWVAANPAVQANIDEFNAAIDAGAYADFPLEMCFTDQWFGFAALSLDEFIAAGGVAEIPAFDPNLTAD